MEEKIRFIGDYLNGVFNFTELCERYRISRKTGYKWVDRYVEDGVDGLKDRSRSPKDSPQKTPEYMQIPNRTLLIILWIIAPHNCVHPVFYRLW